jgi:hypothetical protein
MNAPTVAFAVLAGLILIAFLVERFNLHRARKRWERDRDRESANLSHITGTPPWWREPPNSGPEDDH